MARTFLTNSTVRPNPKKIVFDPAAIKPLQGRNGINMADWIQEQIATGIIDTSESSEIREEGGGLQIGANAALNITGIDNVILGA